MTLPKKPPTEIALRIESEIDPLKAVLLHRPGAEVENMGPENAEKALYSDILNLSVAQKEYAELFLVLSKVSRTLEVKHLLAEILEDEATRPRILADILADDCRNGLAPADLADAKPKQLAAALIEGVRIERDSLTRFLSEETFSLTPLHNLLFVRDTAMVLGNRALIGRPSSPVRRRESRIMHALFSHHPQLRSDKPPVLPPEAPDIAVEGGDVLVVRKDVLAVGIGNRTTPAGVDALIARFAGPGSPVRHILVQELPRTLESFIHLDMVFTLLDRDRCMVHAPLILQDPRFKPIHITVDGEKIRVEREAGGLLDALRGLGIDLKPVVCGGKTERHQQREQWHSGANFFAVAPGKVLGYARNEYTLDALHQAGFEILSARDVISGRTDIGEYPRCVVAIRGSELARGGGGCRCLTLPLRRAVEDAD